MIETKFDTIKAGVKKITWKVALQSLFKEHARFFVTAKLMDDVSDLKKVMLQSKTVAPYSSYSMYKQDYRSLMKKVHPDHNKVVDAKFSTFLGLANDNLEKVPSEVLNLVVTISKGGKEEKQPIGVYVRDVLDQSLYKGLFSQMIQNADYLSIQNLYDTDAAQSMFGGYNGLAYSQRISSEVEKRVSEVAKSKISDGDCEVADEEDVTQDEIGACISTLNLKLDLNESKAVEESVRSGIESDYQRFIDTQLNKAFLNGYNSPVEFLHAGYHEMYDKTKKEYCRDHASVCAHPEIIDSVIAHKVFGELLPDPEVIFKS
ncbi:MAG: hypothetical protein KBC27_03285 [Rickettsiales bacterium]|nr:hypothetical protein [Rickettsiales bacterium]